MIDKYADLRAALDAMALFGSWSKSRSHIDIAESDEWCDVRINVHANKLASRKVAGYLKLANPETIRALLAERDALMQSLRWTAGALQTSFEINAPVAEADLFFLEGDAKTGTEILNAADSALAQHQGS